MRNIKNSILTIDNPGYFSKYTHKRLIKDMKKTFIWGRQYDVY